MQTQTDSGGKVKPKKAKGRAIDLAPGLRALGVVEISWHPLCSEGKRPGRRFTSRRRFITNAVRFPSIALNWSAATVALIVDLDGPEKVRTVRAAVEAGRVPEPNWIVGRGANGHGHAVWLLDRPVWRGAGARPDTLAFCKFVLGNLTLACDGDPGYRGHLTHNPITAAESPDFWVEYGSHDPYDPAEILAYSAIAEASPDLSLRIREKTSNRSRSLGVALKEGRHNALFNELRDWASKHPAGTDLLPQATELNLTMFSRHKDGLLEDSSVISTATSVCRGVKSWQEGRPARVKLARRAGQESGRVRGAPHVDRNATILELHQGGQSQRKLATQFGLSRGGIRRILGRGGL